MDALCKVSANGRRLLNCSCQNGFLGTGPICRGKLIKIMIMVLTLRSQTDVNVYRY